MICDGSFPTTLLALVLAVPVRTYAQGVPDSGAVEPPGASFLSQVLGWLKWGALWAAVAGLLVGGISIGVGHFGSNYGAASAGRKWLLGGMGAAVVAGLAWTIANTIYTSTS